MRKHEILQANLLDIIFEHRNKSYGAYALRKTYPQRLQWAVTSAIALSSLLFIITILKKSDPIINAPKGEIVITPYNPDQPKQQQPPPEKTEKREAQVKATDKIVLTPNTNNVVENTEIDEAKPSTETVAGTRPTLDTATASTNTGNGPVTTQPSQPEVHFSSSEAEFKGGKEAFAKFLHDWLQSPDELEPGQQQKVSARFKVDVDGSISDIQIVQSGGASFDREVIRVLKKMPKWKPAEQNGVKVPVYFTQVVTFVGVEQ